MYSYDIHKQTLRNISELNQFNVRDTFFNEISYFLKKNGFKKDLIKRTEQFAQDIF